MKSVKLAAVGVGTFLVGSLTPIPVVRNIIQSAGVTVMGLSVAMIALDSGSCNCDG